VYTDQQKQRDICVYNRNSETIIRFCSAFQVSVIFPRSEKRSLVVAFNFFNNCIIVNNTYKEKTKAVSGWRFGGLLWLNWLWFQIVKPSSTQTSKNQCNNHLFDGVYKYIKYLNSIFWSFAVLFQCNFTWLAYKITTLK
jgi:hypothetical protein